VSHGWNIDPIEKSWRTLGIRKMQPKFDQNFKKIEILTLYPGFDGMVKKTSHATVPLSKVPVRNFMQCKSTCYFEKSWVCCVGAPAFREKCELFMHGTKNTTYLGIYQSKGSWYRVFLGQKRQNYVCYCTFKHFPGKQRHLLSEHFTNRNLLEK
jgi:hypothetical protein